MSENTNEKYEKLRKAWFATSQRRFAEELIGHKWFVELVEDLQRDFPPYELYAYAKDLMERVESGNFKSAEEVKHAEAMISACLLGKITTIETSHKASVEKDEERAVDKYENSQLKKLILKEELVTDEDTVHKLIKEASREEKEAFWKKLSEKFGEEEKNTFVDGKKLAERRDPELNGGYGGIEISKGR